MEDCYKLIPSIYQNNCFNIVASMDRRWMYVRRDSLEYAQGMEMFLSFALKHVEDPNSILCPCVDSNNTVQSNVDGVRDHLVTNGINQA